jgi:hypothetical protein
VEEYVGFISSMILAAALPVIIESAGEAQLDASS